MSIHEKAALYDELLKDYEKLHNKMQEFKGELEELPNKPDFLELKSKNSAHYYAMLSGAFQAMPMALSYKLWDSEFTLKHHKSLNNL